jgi:hypothetical protein
LTYSSGTSVATTVSARELRDTTWRCGLVGRGNFSASASRIGGFVFTRAGVIRATSLEPSGFVFGRFWICGMSSRVPFALISGTGSLVSPRCLNGGGREPLR